MDESRSSSDPERPTKSQFRSWLVLKLSLASFAVFKDDTDESIAKRIGVQVDVLHEARELYQIRMAARDVPLGQELGFRLRLSENHAQRNVWLEPPRVIYDDWMERCKSQKVRSSTLLRSVVHLVLQSQTQPAWLTDRKHAAWVYRGRWIMHENIRDRTDRCRVRTNLNEGADLALHERAEHTKISVSALARWGICLMVNNQISSLEIVHAAHAMYKKPEQYCLKPRIT